MKGDCKGRGSAPSSDHLSQSLLEKTQLQEIVWYPKSTFNAFSKNYQQMNKVHVAPGIFSHFV